MTKPTIDISRFQTFWSWWIGELRAMLPSSVIGWFVGDMAMTDVMVDDQNISLVRLEAGKPATYSVVPKGAALTSPVLRELRDKGREAVRLLLSGDQVLVKNISLPMAVEENLREAIGFELDRYTPFKPAQVYYDLAVLKRDAQKESIDATLVVASRARVDALLAELRSAGLVVAAIGAAAMPPGGQSIDLLPTEAKPARKWGNLVRLNLGLLVAAVLLGLIAMMLPIWQKREEVIQLMPLVGKAGVEFEVSQRVYEEYTRLANQYNYITGKKHGMQPSLAIIEELAKISPDTTIVQSVELKSTGKLRELTMVGEAQSASKVIEGLEQSPLFQNATSRAPSTRGSQPNSERFQVATEVKPKPLPPAAVIADAAPPLASQIPPAIVSPTNQAETNGVAAPAPAATPTLAPSAASAAIGAIAGRAEAPPPPAAEKSAPATSTPAIVAPTAAPPANRKQP